MNFYINNNEPPAGWERSASRLSSKNDTGLKISHPICLFFRDGIVLLIYVDDCLIFTPEKHRADAFIKELEKRFTIEDEGDITNYLGINITNPDADTIQMVQPACVNQSNY